MLAKNQLNFAYFAFSDDGIDYSGSLTDSNSNFSGNIDNIVFRNLSFEGVQKKDQDLSSFLYTISADSKKVPELVVSVSSSNRIDLKRTYKTLTVNELNKLTVSPIDVVLRVTTDPEDRVSDYVIQQNVLKYINKSIGKK